MDLNPHPRDRWFEDWSVGDTFRSNETYVMNQDRMVEFGLEFDPQFFHVDVAAAEASHFGGIVASGWHTGAAMMSLVAQYLGEAALGAAGLDELRFPQPVRVGDELRLTWTVLELRRSKSKPDRGIMRVEHQLHNQHDELVFRCEATSLLRARTTG